LEEHLNLVQNHVDEEKEQTKYNYDRFGCRVDTFYRTPKELLQRQFLVIKSGKSGKTNNW
jgi:hypothetical protein